jgi:hypothetical protein
MLPVNGFCFIVNCMRLGARTVAGAWREMDVNVYVTRCVVFYIYFLTIG